jgi:hypothetical protein
VTNRRQRVLIAVIIAIGLLRGMWWVVATPIWSPIDEQAHYDNARFGRIATVGETRVERDVLEVAKASPTSPWQSAPVPPDPQRPEWGAFAHSYEAAQPPLYYVVMWPFSAATSAFRTLVSLYALRVVSLLLSLALIPLVWLIGRELFPARPQIGVGAAAVAALLSGVNGNFAIVANDGLMTVLAAAVLLAMARVVRSGFSSGRAVVVGILVGAAVLAKLTAISVVGVVAIGAVVAARRHGRSPRDVARFGLIAGGVVAGTLVPWVLSNVIAYGGVTASEQLDAITGHLQSDPPLNLDGLRTRLGQAGHGFWDSQLLDTTTSTTGVVWFVFAAAVGVVALVRRREERGVLGWLYSAWPLAFLTMVFVILGISGGRSDIAGRHLYVALPALVVGVVAATFLVAKKWAVVLLATVCAVGLTFEARDAPGVMRGIYANGAFGNLTPVVDRPYADRVMPGREFTLGAPCPIVAIRLVFREAAPELRINDVTTRPFSPEAGAAQTVAALYAVAGAPTRAVVEVPTDAEVASSRDGPAHRLYCVDDDNYGARFAQTFRRGHPPLTAAQVAFPPRMWAVLGWMTVIAALARSIGRWGRSGAGASASRSSSSAAL